MAGKLQDQDFKTSAELVTAGATAASLLNDTKIYVTANSLNKTLSAAIIAGDLAGGASAPVGAITMFGSSTAPTGWILCDGSSLLRTGTYAALFAVIGTTFGNVDGTHFNAPNFSGIFPRGNGSQTISGISYNGSTVGTAQGDQMQGHYHNKTLSASPLLADSTGKTADQGSGLPIGTPSTLSITGPSSDGTNGTPRTGTETRPAALTVAFIIKY